MKPSGDFSRPQRRDEWQSDHMAAPSTLPLPPPPTPTPILHRYYKPELKDEPEPEYYEKKEDGPDPYLCPCLRPLNFTIDAKA